MEKTIIAFSVFLLTNLAARLIAEKANKKINKEQKAGLIDLFSQNRITYGAITALVIMVFLVSTYYFPKYFFPIVLTFFVTILLLAIIRSVSNYQKLKAHKYPATFIKEQITCTVISLLGFVIFFVVLIFLPY